MFPILFSLGPLTVYTFGIFFALSFLTGTFLVWHFGRSEVNDEIILDAVVISFLSGILGGRIAYILFNPNIFGTNFLKMLHFFNFPGISYGVSLLVSVAVLIAYLIRQKQKIMFFLDFFALGTCIALILGNLGCFLNGCVVGKATNLPWALPVLGKLGRRHPLPLYEILILVLIYSGIYYIYKNKKSAQKHFDLKSRYLNKDGITGGIFLLSLGISQFLLEFLREGSVYWGSLKPAQVIDLILIIFSLFFFVRLPAIPKIPGAVKINNLKTTI